MIRHTRCYFLFIFSSLYICYCHLFLPFSLSLFHFQVHFASLFFSSFAILLLLPFCDDFTIACHAICVRQYDDGVYMHRHSKSHKTITFDSSFFSKYYGVLRINISLYKQKNISKYDTHTNTYPGKVSIAFTHSWLYYVLPPVRCSRIFNPTKRKIYFRIVLHQYVKKSLRPNSVVKIFLATKNIIQWNG